MALAKQEFYEGAAIHLLARTGKVAGVRFESPFFVFNDKVLVLLKYSTRVRSPWAFTFTPSEQAALISQSTRDDLVIALVCGSDGVAAFRYAEYLSIAAPREQAVHVACYRRHGEHYEVNGPDGTMRRKVPPSGWQRVLDNLRKVDEA